MSTDRAKQGILALIRSAFPKIDYMAFYRGRLVAQSADFLNVDVQPDDNRIPGLSGIPLRAGIPGATAQIAPGAFLYIGWDGGDPRFPYAMPAWESGAHTIELKLNADTIVLNGGTLKVARETDPVDAGMLSGTAGPFPVNFVHVDSKTGVTVAGPSVSLTGKITDGVGSVKA